MAKKKRNFSAVTLVFYEYPAALHNITDWEGLINKQVIYKMVYNHKSPGNEGLMVFVLDKSLAGRKSDFNYELLLCIPVNKAEKTDEFYKMVNERLDAHIDGWKDQVKIYLKTLIFGSVFLFNLDAIKQVILNFKATK